MVGGDGDGELDGVRVESDAVKRLVAGAYAVSAAMPTSGTCPSASAF